MEKSWEDYKCFFGGRFVTGIRGFSYGVAKNKEHIWAEGSDPVGVGQGNRTPRTQIKVLGSELSAILDATGGDATNAKPFTVVHQFARKGSAAISTTVITGVEFTDWEEAMDQGATFEEVTLPCICMKVIPNVSKAALMGKFNIMI